MHTKIYFRTPPDQIEIVFDVFFSSSIVARIYGLSIKEINIDSNTCTHTSLKQTFDCNFNFDFFLTDEWTRYHSFIIYNKNHVVVSSVKLLIRRFAS
jgi:hypothetical protein